MTGRKIQQVKFAENGTEYVPSINLKEGPRSRCTAFFYRNKHENTGDYIPSLKITRYGIKKGEFYEKEEKSITLGCDELAKLVKYLEENYRPLSIGEKSYISLDDSNISTVFEQISALKIADESMVEKLYNSGILTENLGIAITAAERKKTIEKFEKALDEDHDESFWQSFFSNNRWILGSEYVKIINNRDLDVQHIADYLMKTTDNFLDLAEIKKPAISFWSKTKDHNNYIPSSSLVCAIIQCLNYLQILEQQADSNSYKKIVEQTNIVKPQCLLVFGRSNDWDDEKREAYRILNAAYHQINIITYDQLLARAKILLGDTDLKKNIITLNETDCPF